MNFLDSKSFYFKISLITLFVVFAEMVLGSWVKSIEGGLSCPQWPLCYGQLIPLDSTNFNPYTMTQVWSEYIHRLVATLVSFFLVLLCYLTYRHRDEITPNKEHVGQKRFQIAIIIVVLLALQVILGGLTVILDTNPYIVTSHLTVATILFGLTVWMTTKISPQED